MNKHKRYIAQRKKRLSKRRSHTHLPVVVPSVPAVAAVQTSEAQLVSHDKHLLERSRTQWQFGDWESLAQLTSEVIQHHPDRAKLALLAAAGLIQIGQVSDAGELIRLAKEWGCSKRLIYRILASGAHNSIAKASALSGQDTKALEHFRAAMEIGAPQSDVRLLTQVRTSLQLTHLRGEQADSGLFLNGPLQLNRIPQQS